MEKEEVFFVGQKAFIAKGDEVLVLGYSNGKLDYPGGKIQVGETNLAESLKREVREETGLEIEVGEPFVTWFKEFTDHPIYSGKKLFLVGYRCTYVSGEVCLQDGHDTFSWVTKENYTKIDNGRSYFKILHKYFSK